MNKIIFSFIIFLLSTFTIFSDWEPFQLGRTNYYVSSLHFSLENNPSFFPQKSFRSIHEFTFDSISFNKKFLKNQYFNSRLKLINNRFYYCDITYKTLLNNYREALKDNSFSDLGIGSTDFYFYHNDTIFYYNCFMGELIDDSRGFYIPLNINLNDSCLNNGYKIQLYNVSYSEILPGIKDSVKGFLIEFENDKSKFLFRLSKHYGFIEFTNFDIILSRGDNMYINNNSLNLVGTEFNDEKIGFNKNSKNEISFYDLKVGDKKYWWQYEERDLKFSETYIIATVYNIELIDSLMIVSYHAKHFVWMGG